MNKELLESQWVQAREFIKDKYSNLTDEDIRQINGRYDQLVSKLQLRYGFTREEAEEELRKLAFDKNVKTFGHEKTFSRPVKEDEFSRTKTTESTDASTFFKWLLLIGIPLVLLASYFSYENAKVPVVTPPTQTVTQAAVETPTDQLISQDIRSALANNPVVAPALNDITIFTSNGVVTVRGTVSSTQERDAILNVIQTISGVRQMNNQLIVR